MLLVNVAILGMVPLSDSPETNCTASTSAYFLNCLTDSYCSISAEKPVPEVGSSSSTPAATMQQTTTRTEMRPVKYHYADSFWCTYLISVFAASIAETVTYPLDLTKTRLQIQGEGAAAAAGTIKKVSVIGWDRVYYAIESCGRKRRYVISERQFHSQTGV